MTNPFVAISLGWGVQSWTLAAMSALGALPKVDAAVHSDTQHERGVTYDFAQQWTPWLEGHGIKIATVVNQGYGATDVVIKNNKIQIPAFTIGDSGKGQVRRQCTMSWKISPLRRWLQEHRNKRPVELWLGISTDEWQRAKDSDRKYLKHRFPLLDLGMSRQDCLDWLAAHDLPSPGKSSCVFCPFLNKDAWINMRLYQPEDFAKAVEIDEAIRHVRMPGELFVHSSRKPLEEAVSANVDTANQSALRELESDDQDAECDSGHCFL